MAGGRIPEDDLRVALIGATPLKSDSRSDNEIQIAKSLARFVRSGPIFFNGISRRDAEPVSSTSALKLSFAYGSRINSATFRVAQHPGQNEMRKRWMRGSSGAKQVIQRNGRTESASVSTTRSFRYAALAGANFSFRPRGPSALLTVPIVGFPPGRKAL